ncbi:M23 family metallopeptidase [Streptomyces sulphureus]|uniref:M23 family metallopeptidase n=1 Tax=Streptomyces sulphureus TaxID=47758 RepID=UPI00035ECDC0|nr:LysM peptidoglycan-binding domain-containing M23 family metallopeptidase [Streptomyces sulphureus]
MAVAPSRGSAPSPPHPAYVSAVPYAPEVSTGCAEQHAGEARARHRASREGRTRRLATRASAAGASLALPFVGASMANAGSAEGGSYTVESGDTLSTIAEERNVEGGWKGLYAADESTLGSDPDVLRPGQQLTLRTEQAVRPVSGGTGTAEYQASGADWSQGHTGTDIAVPVGTPVSAAVHHAGWDDAFGHEAVVEHADGKYSHYAHLSETKVEKGQRVAAGDRVALSGSTGNTTGPHLRFEVRTTPGFGSAIDPVKWLAGYGVTL